MRPVFFKAATLCLLIASPISISQVYKFVDESGNVSYSDTPPTDNQDMKPAELPEIFYQPGVEVPDRAIQQETVVRDISVSISSPKEGATISGSQASFSVSALTSRKLINGEMARLLVNGTPHSTGPALGWSVTDLIRGDYSLSVEIIDKNQQTIASSASVRVFVKRNIAR